MTARELMVARLAATPRLLREMTADLSGETAARPPKPGDWPVAEVVRHLVEGDRETFLPRLRRMLAEARPAFDKTPPTAGDRADLATLVAAFASAREQAVKILRGLDDAGWRREGVSPSRGPLSVETYATTMDAHDTEHLGQIQDVRAALGLPPKRCEARAPMRVAEVVAAIEEAPARLAALPHGLTEAQRRHRPHGDGWCLNEVMAHLLHVETEVFFPRLRRMRDEDHPVFPAFSPEPWARERDHSVDPFDASLAGFARARAATVELLRALPDAAAGRVGVSGTFGPLSIAQYATHVAEHDIEHLAQMADCRRAAGA